MVGTARRIPNQSDFFSPRASSLRSLCLLLDGNCHSSLAEASSLMCPATAVLVVEVDVNGTLMHVLTGVHVICQSVSPLQTLGRAHRLGQR